LENDDKWIIFHLDGKPYRVNCGTHYPFAKGVRDYFPHDVVRAVDISVDMSAIGSTKQAPLHTLAHIVLMLTDWFIVEKTTLRGVTFLSHNHMDTYQFGFVGQHVDKTCVRDGQ